MEASGQEVDYLSSEEIPELNRRLIESTGGLFIPPANLANPNALEYTQALIRLPGGGFCPYSTLEEKAAALKKHKFVRARR